MAIIGPGTQNLDIIEPKPTLDGANEFEVIEILNPLSDDFQIQVAQDVPVNLPFEIRKDGKTSVLSNTEADVRQTYGLALKNADHQARKRITNNAIIKSGQTMRLRGSEAQVAVRQLVNEILQRQGKRQFLSDPTTRKIVEDEIIISRGSIQDMMDGNLQTPRQQMDDALNKANEVRDEFPELRQTVTGNDSDSESAGRDNPTAPKRIGRPPKEASNT